MTPREARAALFKRREATVKETRAEVAACYGLTVADIEGRSMIPPAPEARREVMTRLWERGLSLSEIGRLLGRHASTVHAAVAKSLGDQYVEMSAGPGKVRQIQDVEEGSGT